MAQRARNTDLTEKVQVAVHEAEPQVAAYALRVARDNLPNFDSDAYAQALEDESYSKVINSVETKVFKWIEAKVLEHHGLTTKDDGWHEARQSIRSGYPDVVRFYDILDAIWEIKGTNTAIENDFETFQRSEAAFNKWHADLKRLLAEIE